VEVLSKDVALERLHDHKKQLLAGAAGCVMCALARGGAHPVAIAEGPHAVVLLDRFACRYGHLMVVPRAHVECVDDLAWDIYSDTQRLVFEAMRAIDRCFKPARVFTATLGAAVELPMTYAHYHVHVIPVYETDERARPARVLSWSEGVTVYEDEEAERLRQRLADAWPAVAASRN
jgi:histidine triad (HIT) family protein